MKLSSNGQKTKKLKALEEQLLKRTGYITNSANGKKKLNNAEWNKGDLNKVYNNTNGNNERNILESSPLKVSW